MHHWLGDGTVLEEVAILRWLLVRFLGVAAVVAELDSVVLLPFLLPLPRPVLFSYIFAASFVLWTVKLLIATVVKFWFLLVLQELLVQQALEWAFLLTLPDHNHSNEHALVD